MNIKPKLFKSLDIGDTFILKWEYDYFNYCESNNLLHKSTESIPYLGVYKKINETSYKLIEILKDNRKKKNSKFSLNFMGYSHLDNEVYPINAY